MWTVLAFLEMDDFDDSIGDADERERGSKLANVAILIAVLGIVVGVAGIFLANQAQKQVVELEARLAAAPDKTPELQATITDLDERLVKLGSEFVKLGRQDRQMQENTQTAFDAVTRDIRTNREGLNQLSEKMSELVEKLENWSPSARSSGEPSAEAVPATGSGTGSAAADGEASGPEDGVYFIQSGDTLSGIAKRYGLTLSRLQQANPTVNPRALQIGQRIVIPSP